MVMHAGDMERVLPRLVWHLEDLRVGQCYPNYLHRSAGQQVRQGGAFRRRRRRTVCRLSLALLPRPSTTDFGHYIGSTTSFWQRLVPDEDMPRLFKPSRGRQIDGRLDAFDVFKRRVRRRTRSRSIAPTTTSTARCTSSCRRFCTGCSSSKTSCSMAHSLETRVPFLDNDLVDFAMRVPVAHKLGPIS